MTGWLAGYFFHPSFVAGGLSLVAAPILIHLINRLRYRRVRFAAMEFLLKSEQRNRRRLLIEQLLLLLLRILIVLAIVALVARMVVDPRQLSLFRGEKTHHVILIDDSLSMRDRQGESTVFRDALALLQELVSEGAKRPETQIATLILQSNPEQPVFSERDVDEPFMVELASRIDAGGFVCSHQAPDPAVALEAVQRMFDEQKTGAKQLHWLSDFREGEWSAQQNPSAPLTKLAKSGVLLNLVRLVADSRANLGVSHLTGDLQMAAAGVPVRFTATVRNFSTLQTARDVRLTVSDNGAKLPASLIFEQLAPGEEQTQTFDVRLATAGPHRVSVRLPADTLSEDDERHVLVDVANRVNVLIIDGDAGGESGQFVKDAVAADPQSTGIEAKVENLEFLRRNSLGDYRAVVLVDVPELPVDAAETLEAFVRQGGGLAWFAGPRVRSASYASPDVVGPNRLMPLPLGLIRELPIDVSRREPDLRVSAHPLFAVMSGEDNPFLAAVKLSKHILPDAAWKRDDVRRADGVRTIASVENGAPLILEHRLDAGTVVTCLTSASPAWTNWPLNPSYVVFQLELIKHLAAGSQPPAAPACGAPWAIRLDPALYSDAVEIQYPGDNGGEPATAKLQAALTSDGSPPRYAADFTRTDVPGFYRARFVTQQQQVEERWEARNVPPTESNLSLATSSDLRKRLGSTPVQIQEPGQRRWVQGEEAGAEMRNFLLAAILVMLAVEQWLAYRLSYHPPLTRAAA